jgi:hypothetical protein
MSFLLRNNSELRGQFSRQTRKMLDFIRNKRIIFTKYPGDGEGFIKILRYIYSHMRPVIPNPSLQASQSFTVALIRERS